MHHFRPLIFIFWIREIIMEIFIYSSIVHLFSIKWPISQSTKSPTHSEAHEERTILIGPNSPNRRFCIFSIAFAPDAKEILLGCVTLPSKNFLNTHFF